MRKYGIILPCYFMSFLVENSWNIQMLAESTTVVQADENKVFFHYNFKSFPSL